MARSPRAASNALPDGSTTSVSWRRCTFTVCRDLIDALSRRDTRVGDGWEWGGPRLCGVDDPCFIRGAPCPWRGACAKALRGIVRDLHIALVALMRACLPAGTPVVLLGDGEFDGTTRQETLNEAGWC